MQVDAQLVTHEGPSSDDAGPRFGVRRLELAAQGLVSEREAAFDVGGEVVAAGGGDDIDLQSHA